MKKRKLMIGGALIVTVMGLVAGFLGCSNDKKVGASSNPTVSTMSASYAIDVSDPNELFNSADYIFTADVQDVLSSNYREESYEPYVTYQVMVMENIKGELDLENPIEIIKNGGISEDGSEYYVFEEDIIPEIDNSYLFLAFVQEDGSILVSGANSTFNIGTAAANQIEGEDNVGLKIKTDDPYEAFKSLSE